MHQLPSDDDDVAQFLETATLSEVEARLVAARFASAASVFADADDVHRAIAASRAFALGSGTKEALLDAQRSLWATLDSASCSSEVMARVAALDACGTDVSARACARAALAATRRAFANQRGSAFEFCAATQLRSALTPDALESDEVLNAG